MISITLPSKTYAGDQVVFFEDFENYTTNTITENWEIARNIQWHNPSLPCMNGSNPAKWEIYNVFGSKRIGITLNGPSCIFEIIPKYFQLSNANSYRYDVEVTFPQSLRKDRNVAFRYRGPYERYNLQITNLNATAFEKVMSVNSKVIGYPFPFNLQINETYKFSFINQDNLITFLINDIEYGRFEDNYPILDSGTIALQASLGVLGAQTVYFDNMKVTDLTEDPAPVPLAVPHFSQLDPLWKNELYDHADKVYPPNLRQIEDLGCALTSAAMILKYNGYHLGPDGLETNPSNLNRYLSQNGGYTRNGGVIWGYISKYAKEARVANEVQSGLPLLEFDYRPYSFDLINQDYLDGNPSMLKILMSSAGNFNNYHFVVAKGIGQEDIFINDPLDLIDMNTLLSTKYQTKPVVQVGRFKPTYTDLSYLFGYAYSNTAEMLLETEGQKLGKDEYGNVYQDLEEGHYISEEIAYPIDFEDLFSPEIQAKSLLLAKPAKSSYKISVSSSLEEIVPVELHWFDSEGEARVYRRNVFTGQGLTAVLKLTADTDNLGSGPEMIYFSDFDRLKRLIVYLRKHELILNDQVKDHLLSFTTAAENVYEKNQKTVLIQVLKQHIDNDFSQNGINQQGLELLDQEIGALLKYLSNY